MTFRFKPKSVPQVGQEEAGNDPGFFQPEEEGTGAYDANAKKHYSQQIALCNRIEDLTKVTFWEARGKFSVHDYNLCFHNDPKRFVGVANCITELPIMWQKVDALAELKYRTVPSSLFKSTLIDAEKIQSLNTRVRDMHISCYVIWAFQDCDMYWKVDPELQFPVAVGRNTKTTDDVPWEHKLVAFIPMSYLSICTADMFYRGRQI